MSNEEGYFAIYWALHQQKMWDKTRRGIDPAKPPVWWLEGYKDVAHDAWMARASLPVTHGGADG